MFRFVMGVACALMLFGCNGRPGSSANIPIDGIGGNGGAGGGTHCALICDGDDVCGVAGVEECCTDCETCEVCETCETCETCEVCPPPEIVEVFFCFERVEVCPKTFCTKTGGGDYCGCTHTWQWVEHDNADECQEYRYCF